MGLSVRSIDPVSLNLRTSVRSVSLLPWSSLLLTWPQAGSYSKRNCFTCSNVHPEFGSSIVIAIQWSVIPCIQGISVENGREWLVTKIAGVQLVDLERDQDIWDCVCQVTFELL